MSPNNENFKTSTLYDILNDLHGKKLFREFLNSECSEEFIEFWYIVVFHIYKCKGYDTRMENSRE